MQGLTSSTQPLLFKLIQLCTCLMLTLTIQWYQRPAKGRYDRLQTVGIKVCVSHETSEECAVEVGSWWGVELHTHGLRHATWCACSKQQSTGAMKSQGNTLICWFGTVFWISLYFVDLLNTGGWRRRHVIPSGCNLPASCFEPAPKYPLAS